MHSWVGLKVEILPEWEVARGVKLDMVEGLDHDCEVHVLFVKGVHYFTLAYLPRSHILEEYCERFTRIGVKLTGLRLFSQWLGVWVEVSGLRGVSSLVGVRMVVIID